MGCFYVESPAMRMLLKKLRCDDYVTLVAASSIIRPGVSQSGMMREEAYFLPNLTTNLRTWVFPKKESPQGFDYIGSKEPFPYGFSPIGKLLELGHLWRQQSLPSTQHSIK